MALDIDFFEPALLEDPYPTYARLRAEAPAYWSDQLGAFVLTRFEDVRGSLHNHEVFSSKRMSTLIDTHVQREADRFGVFSPAVKPLFRWVGLRRLGPFIDIASRFMWQRDPPEHTRLRRLMHQAFLNSETSRMRPRIEALADRLIAQIQGDSCEYMEAFAVPLPAMIIAEIFGIPEDWAKIKDWADDIKVYLGGSASKQARDEALSSILAMRGYFEGAIAQRRAAPQDDFISALCEAGDLVEDELELIANIIVTIGAGQVTTQDMLGNGLLALLQHPEQLQALRDDPSKIAGAIDEMLRYDGPVQLTQRVTRATVEIGQTTIPEGSLVYLIRGAANRDGAQWSDPDTFDITRENTRHVAFGAGIHYCIGAALARLEGEVAFHRLLETFEVIELDGEPRWRCDNLQFRGLDALNLRLVRRDGPAA